jgi:nucleoid DNA-binding protein
MGGRIINAIFTWGEKIMAKTPASVKERMTKTQMLNAISEETGVARKEVGAVLDSLAGVIGRHVNKRGIGEFVLPGLLKIKTVKKPAQKARKGVNPFTGEEQMFKAKPASVRVRISALKKLKDMAQ